MNKVREYVATLPDEEKFLIIQGFEKLEATGMIGDEPIRLHSNALLDQLNMDHDHITRWMELMTFECYRYFSQRCIEQWLAGR